MDYVNPTLLVISGPNGAGKSTHIESMLPSRFDGVVPFDRDLTRMQFEDQFKCNGTPDGEIAAKSAEMMEAFLIEKMDQAIRLKQHFVLETPLSHPDYWRYIDRFESNGYQIQLNYLCLDKVKDCEQRVRMRVKEGGHAVDARTIKGVYEKNLQHINSYAETFKMICLYDGMVKPTLLTILENNEVVMANANALKKNWLRAGLPVIWEKVAVFVAAQKDALRRGKRY